jgi:hypothetical protein
MDHFIEIDIQDQNHNSLLICASMNVAIAFCELHNLQIIDQSFVPEFNDNEECTGENILIITVQ